jgi:hypothetical protein
MSEPPPDPRREARRTILLGAAILLVSLGVVFSPILLGRGSLNRFIVVSGLAGVFIGGGAVIHGAWDWLRGRGP